MGIPQLSQCKTFMQEMNGSVFKKVLSVRIKGKGRIKAKDVFALSSHTALLRNGFMEMSLQEL